MKKGKFIVIEGTDGSGKNTQKELLVKRFKKWGFPVEGISFPRYGTPTGDIIGDIYLGKTNRTSLGNWFGDADKVNPQIASLYFAADRVAHREKMLNLLDDGVNIISDRYVESNMGHQGGKIKNYEERRNFIDFLVDLEYNLLELPKPDSVVFLYLPYQIALKAVTNRGNSIDGHENESHMKNAEQSYLELSDRFNWEKIICCFGMQIRSKEEIHDEVWNSIKDIL